jgi:hypothetical protein
MISRQSCSPAAQLRDLSGDVSDSAIKVLGGSDAIEDLER